MAKANGTLERGVRYELDLLDLVGWDAPKGSDLSGYDLASYFTSDGRYKGADMHGVEPVVEVVELLP